MDKRYSQLKEIVNTVKPPIHIIAFHNEKLMGVVALKLTEMEQFPKRKYWLGSLFVAPEFRGQGVAVELEMEIIKTAKLLSIFTLYLQTESLDGGLYTYLGWKALEEVSYQGITVQVMMKKI